MKRKFVIAIVIAVTIIGVITILSLRKVVPLLKEDPNRVVIDNGTDVSSWLVGGYENGVTIDDNDNTE